MLSGYTVNHLYFGVLRGKGEEGGNHFNQIIKPVAPLKQAAGPPR